MRRDDSLGYSSADERLRNIYPFMTFVGLSVIKRGGLFLDDMQVIVREGVPKDWQYVGDAYLAEECLRNYEIVFGPGSAWRAFGECYFLWAQAWRMGIGKSTSWHRVNRATAHVRAERVLSPASRMMLYPVLALREIRERVASMMRGG